MIAYDPTAMEPIERADWCPGKECPWTPTPLEILKGSCAVHRDLQNDRSEGTDCSPKHVRQHREVLVDRAIMCYCERFAITDVEGFRLCHHL